MPFFPGGKYSYFAVLAADINVFFSGTAIAWSSPMIQALETDDISEIPLGRKITGDEESWIGALSAMGGIFGPPIFGYISQRFGRKLANTLVVVPYLLAYLITAFAKEIWLFYVGRILMGMGIGGCFSVTTIYAVEVAEDVNRGVLSTSITNAIMLGMLFSNCVGSYTSIMVFNLILAALCIVYFPLFWYIAPETPYYWVSVNKDEEALKSLRYLRRRPSAELQKELHQIKVHISELEEGSFLDIFKTKASIKALAYSVILTSFQQFSGLNVIWSFTQNIFDATGSNLSSAVSSIIVTAAQFVASFATPLSADRFGRRRMLLVGIPGSTLALIVLGVYFNLQENGDDVSGISWLPIVSLVVFIVFYNCGPESLPWVIMCEILPSNVISKAAALTTSFYWVTGFFLMKYFAALTEGITMAGTFWLFSGFLAFCWVFVYFFMFETKGKSLKEIQEILNK